MTRYNSFFLRTKEPLDQGDWLLKQREDTRDAESIKKTSKMANERLTKKNGGGIRQIKGNGVVEEFAGVSKSVD